MRATRIERALSQAQLAEEANKAIPGVDIRQADISRWEQGSVPHPKMLLAIADALGVTHRWMILGVDVRRHGEVEA